MNEPWKHDKWNEPETKGHILYDPIQINDEISRIAKSIETERRLVAAKDWGEWEGTAEAFGKMRICLNYIMVIIRLYLLCKYTINHWIIYFKQVSLACKVHLNKVVKRKKIVPISLYDLEFILWLQISHLLVVVNWLHDL